MNYEEFEAHINRMDKELEELKVRLTSFIEDMHGSLLTLSFTLYPEASVDRKKITTALDAELYEACEGMAEWMDRYISLPPDDSADDPAQYKVPELADFETPEKKLADITKGMKLPLDEEWIAEIKKDFEWEYKELQFHFACHKKVKEILYKHFPEIPDFSANAISNLNFSSWCCTSLFTVGFLFVAFNEE